MSDAPPEPAPPEGVSAISEVTEKPKYDCRVRPDPEGKFGDPSPGILSEKQADIACRFQKQFNFFSGGWKAGLSRMVFALATRADLGCVSGGHVAVMSSHPDTFYDDKLRFFRDLEPQFIKRPTGDFIETSNFVEKGPPGSLRLGTLESGRLELVERVDLLIIDNADQIPGFVDMWDKQIEPLVTKWGMRVCVFGRASGGDNPFGKLCLRYRDHPNGRHLEVPSLANPKVTQEGLDAQFPGKSEVELRQEVNGEILVGQEMILTSRQQAIGPNETFLEWCDRLAADGLKVDGKAFRLDNRAAMRWIYDQVPSTKEAAFGKKVVLMKCAQVGFTIMEMLAMVYMALKFSPAKIGMFLPQQNLASMKSTQRFMPIVRTVPDAHKMMLDNPSGTKGGEGNVLTRNMGASVFYFLWTTGKATTESMPMDVLSFDEVQEMSIADMEKTQERLSASDVRWTLMGSTANWPDSDIHFFYQRGSRHRFWTHCPTCGEDQILDDNFPNCIRLVDVVDVIGEQTLERTDYRYVCKKCEGIIHDTQVGEWRPEDPEATTMSIHFPQLLSPTISPREIIESYRNADSMKNFYNRKLGKPYTDPSQVPITLEILNDCARIGMEMGVEWERNGEHYFMGLDQGGLFNVAIVAKRLPSGHMAVVHVEECYGDDPFDRCSELMHAYGIDVCVVESLPNYNDAKRFAMRHLGKVFLASYTQMKDEMMRWGDAAPTAAERKTVEEDRDRFTVTLDQYKCMDVATSRVTDRKIVFPDPTALVQELKLKERSVESELMPILKDRVFFHLTRIALISESTGKDDDRKWTRYVKKIGIDPHFAYAFMLLNVAWSRAHGMTMFLNIDALEGPQPGPTAVAVAEAMPGLPSGVLNLFESPEGTCGRCSAFVDGRCTERNFLTAPTAPGCDLYIQRTEE